MNSPVIFITGAGKGIGKACVLDLIQRSKTLPHFKPRLFLTARTSADLEAVSQMAVNQGIETKSLATDLAQAPQAAVRDCLQSWGRVDLLIHSAGVGRFGDFLDLTLEDLEFVMETNVTASFSLLQLVYGQMKKQKSSDADSMYSPQIQWITSVAAEKPFEQSAIYCMSKFAQRGLLEVMRLYGYRDGIRILEVKPGAAYTPMWGEVPPEMRSKMMEAADVAQAMIDAYFIPTRATLETLTIRPIHGDL